MIVNTMSVHGTRELRSAINNQIIKNDYLKMIHI